MRPGRPIHIAAALAAAATILLSGLQSCKRQEPVKFLDEYNTLGTLRENFKGHPLVLVLDEDSYLIPTNLSGSPFKGKTVRVLAHVVAENEGDLTSLFYVSGFHKGEVTRLDSIRTKPLDPPCTPEEGGINELGFEFSPGEDRIEIMDNWMACVEDGFLTIPFSAPFGGTAKHDVRLRPVQGEPGTLRLFHFGNGDAFGPWSSGVVAFDLDGLELPPHTPGDIVELTVLFVGKEGPKKVVFPFKTY